MPEMLFHVQWPDGTESSCYSPSLVIKEHFAVGDSYPVWLFVEKSRQALIEASERVRARFGFPCSRAIAQISDIERRSQSFSSDPDGKVHLIRFENLS